MTAPILEFQGQYRFLSNFWPCEFVWDNIVWPSSEHAYQAAKTLDRQHRLIMAKVWGEGNIKRIGGGKKPLVLGKDENGKPIEILIRTRKDWEQVKYNLMHEIVLAKFTQNPDLKAKLIATDTAHLEEGNTWHDYTWGVCPVGSGNGKNWLGQILMKVREELK